MHDIKIHIDFNWAIMIAIILSVLKLVKLINWSWLWVFSPIWILAIVTVVMLVIFKIINHKGK